MTVKSKIGDLNALPITMTPREVREKILGISEVTMYQLLARDDFPKMRIGRKYLIPTRQLIDYLEEQSRGVTCKII